MRECVRECEREDGLVAESEQLAVALQNIGAAKFQGRPIFDGFWY